MDVWYGGWRFVILHDCFWGRKTAKGRTSWKCFLLSGHQKLSQNPYVCLFLTGQNYVKWHPELPERLGRKVFHSLHCYITQNWGSFMEEVGNRHHVDNSLCPPQGTNAFHFKFLISKIYIEWIFPLLTVPEVGAVEGWWEWDSRLHWARRHASWGLWMLLPTKHHLEV